MEPRSRPAASTRYHKDWQRRTDNRFHSSTDVDSLPPRSVDKHNHGGTDRRFLRAASRGRRPDGRLSRNDSYPRPDNRHSLPNAQYTSSDNNDSAQVLRRNSGLRQHYSQHHTGGNVLSTQDRQHHNSSSNDWKRRDAQHYTSDVNSPAIRQLTTTRHSVETQNAARAYSQHGYRPRGFGRGRPRSTSPGHASPGNNRDVSGSPMEGILHDHSADTVVASSTGNSLQLTTNEAFTETPDSGSAGSIQTRLSQFAYSGCTRNTVDNK